MTKTAQHSLLFRIWIHIRGLLAILIVLFGILVGLISLILPNEELYKPYVVEFLNKQWDKQVTIEKISGKWQGFGPKFIINGLTIKDKDEVVVEQTTLDVNLIKYLMPKGSTGISIGINNVDIDFIREASGKIVISDEIKSQESLSDKLEKLLATGTVSVNHLSLNLHDSINNKQHQIDSKITVEQTAEKRAFAIEVVSLELAEKLSVKAIADKSYDFMEQAQWYANINNLSLKKLSQLLDKSYIPSALVDVQLWFSTEKGNIVSLMAEADLHDKLFNLSSVETDISGRAELVYKGDKRQWNAELTIEDIKTKTISQDIISIQLLRKDGVIYLNADVLDIPLLKAITQVLGISNDEFAKLNLSGKLTDVAIMYDVELRRIIEAKVNFEQLDFTASFGTLTHLSGTASLHDDQIRFLLDSDQGTAEFPNHIRGKVAWEKLLLTAQTSMQDDYLDIKIKSLWCDCYDFILDGAARVTYDEQLQLDLTFAVYQAQVNQLFKYWPSFNWKPKILNYLDTALVSGVVENGMIIYHGLVEDYPFDHKNGVFLTRSDLRSAKIKYQKDWPEVQGFNAIVETINRQLTVHSTKGKVLQGEIQNVVAFIDNLKNPLLTIDIAAQGKDNFLIDILKQSPMQKGLNVLQEDIVLSGAQNIDVELFIPLSRPDEKVIPKGLVKFNKTDFQMGQFQLADLTGNLAFEGASLYLKNLTGKFLNQEVIVSGEIINETNQTSQLDVLLSGNYDIKNFETTLGFALPAKGVAPWKFLLSNKGQDDINFTAASDLQGVNLEMPEPFVKSADITAPFSITCTLPCIDSGWDLSFNDKITSNFIHDSKTGEVTLNSIIFGHLNDSQSTDFGGTLDIVDVDKWIALLAKNKGAKQVKQLPFKSMSLQVNQLIFMARKLSDVSIEIETSVDGIVFQVNAEEIMGKITIPNDLDVKGVIVQLDKLHWKAIEIELVIEQEVTAPVSGDYPPLHIWIGDFIYDGIPLGESTIEVRPVTDGVRVEKFNTRSELINLTINGSWQRNIGQSGLSQFNIIMTSPDVAKFLKTMGFDAPITQAETIIDMQAQWSDFPSQFEIKNISGNMRIEIGEGEVIDAEPGMGRVLGLFSLTNLPRRLILDFRDVLGKGLRFKSMKGDFTLDNGEAYTESFKIDSASAEIAITGKTGLANQDYDQMVVVTPRVGRVLPTIGAIAGGAVGAAAGFLVQGMFRKGLKDVGKIIYKVTGSWDEPIIELIETELKKHEE